MEWKLPSSLESEKQVLGTMLLGRELAEVALDLLQENDFYSSAHREVFSLVRGMVAEGEAIDVVNVMQELRRKHATAEELMMLRDMAADVTTPAGLHSHARRVREAAMLRHLITASNDIIQASLSPEADAKAIVERAETLIYEATEREARGHITTWDRAMSHALDRLEYMASVPDPITGVPTGYGVLDHRLFGLQPGSFYIVAARPSVGKTSLVTGVVTHAAKAGNRVAFFSLEMSAEELAIRQACSEAEVSLVKVKRDRCTPKDWTAITDAVERLSSLPIDVYDSGAVTAADMAAKARRTKDLKLVVVDYIQLARHHKRTASKNEEVSEISRSLKLLARELNVPVLACAQLNREVETRKGRPKLSDLRDSGALEQDADVVMFLHRDDENTGPVEIITAKNRNGETGIDKLKWRPDLTRFEDLSYLEQMQANRR